MYRLILVLLCQLLAAFIGGRISSHLRLLVILCAFWLDIAIPWVSSEGFAR